MGTSAVSAATVRAQHDSVSPWQQQISISNRGRFGQVTTRRGRPRYASSKNGRETFATPLSQAKLRLSGQFEGRSATSMIDLSARSWQSSVKSPEQNVGGAGIREVEGPRVQAPALLLGQVPR